MQTVAIDTETFPIGPGEVIPEMVCAQFAYNGEGPDSSIRSTRLLGRGAHEEELLPLLEELFAGDDYLLVFLNAGYDLAVIARQFPQLIPAIWAKLARQASITDVGTRERLLNLTTTGQLTTRQLPDGSFQKILYSMEALALRHLGIDLAEAKGDHADNWRVNYSVLEGVPFADYPREAFDYALDDAAHTLHIYEAQQRLVRNERGPGSVHGEYLKTALSFALQIITARGMAIDPAERARLETWIEGELTHEKLNLLYETGILRKGTPRRPLTNSYKRSAEALGIPDDEAKVKTAWTEEELLAVQAAGVRLAKYKAPSIYKAKLHGHVKQVCEAAGIEVKMTEPSATHENGMVATDSTIMNELGLLCPVLAQYQHRQGLQQISSTELPRMQADVVHFRYTNIVSTLRTSSSGGARGKQLYPATNGQNVNPRVREAYVPRPGNVFCASDFDRLELCTLAQKCYDLFGHSVLRDMINAGVDVHSYLGAQIANHLDPDFAESMVRAGIADDRMAMYEAFMTFEFDDSEVLRDFYAKYRKMAKPTGLGYPGGLGPLKFMSMVAGKPYFLDIDLDTAKLLREIWFETFPEMRLYFRWVNDDCVDPNNPPIEVEDKVTGKTRTKQFYCYSTPLGHYRAGAAFTEVANGAGLQSFAADGFTIATFNAVRATHDPSFGSILYGTHIVNQVHDELIGEWPDDELSAPRAAELSDIMERSMVQVVPDVRIVATSALMHRWSKRAVPTFDADGTLVPWAPTPELEEVTA